jgi:Homeodomain-like domain
VPETMPSAPELGFLLPAWSRGNGSGSPGCGTISSRDLPPALPDLRADVRAAALRQCQEHRDPGATPSDSVLQRRVRSPRLSWADRAILAALTRRASAARRRQLSLIVTPRTLLRWHAELVRRHWTYPHRAPGRPRTSPTIRRLVLEMARDNPTWGYRRICGELTGLGHKLAPSTVWEILKAAGIDPAPQRAAASWKQFLSAQAKTIVAVDF